MIVPKHLHIFINTSSILSNNVMQLSIQFKLCRILDNFLLILFSYFARVRDWKFNLHSGRRAKLKF